MELFDVDLVAGSETQIYTSGRFFRMLSGKGRVKLQTSNGTNGEVITGIGLDLRSGEGVGFDWLRFVSPIDQTVTVLVSDLPTTDSRLSGEIDVNGLLQVLNKGGTAWASSTTTLTTGAAVELIAASADRVSGSVQADVDMWIGATAAVTTATGIKVPAGNTLNIENSAAVFVVVNDPGMARVMESIA